jgi:hypothetical protein
MADYMEDQLAALTAQNGQQPDPPRVRFGPGRTQTMPLEWAETMLTAWREKSPRQFGDALAQAAMEAE